VAGFSPSHMNAICFPSGENAGSRDGRQPKQVVTKDDLMKMIWPDTFVEEANLSRNIFLLRKALGESPQDHQYIVTVPARGHRFAEDVQIVPEQGMSVVAASHTKVQVEVKETRPWGWVAVTTILLIAAAVGAFRLLYLLEVSDLDLDPAARVTALCSAPTSPTPSVKRTLLTCRPTVRL